LSFISVSSLPGLPAGRGVGVLVNHRFFNVFWKLFDQFPKLIFVFWCKLVIVSNSVYQVRELLYKILQFYCFHLVSFRCPCCSVLDHGYNLTVDRSIVNRKNNLFLIIFRVGYKSRVHRELREKKKSNPPWYALKRGAAGSVT